MCCFTCNHSFFYFMWSYYLQTCQKIAHLSVQCMFWPWCLLHYNSREHVFRKKKENSNPFFLKNFEFFIFSLSFHNSVNQVMVDHWLCLFTEGIVKHLDIQITSRLKPEMFLDRCRTSLIAFRVTCLVAFNQHVVNFVKFMVTSTY